MSRLLKRMERLKGPHGMYGTVFGEHCGMKLFWSVGEKWSAKYAFTADGMLESSNTNTYKKVAEKNRYLVCINSV